MIMFFVVLKQKGKTVVCSLLDADRWWITRHYINTHGGSGVASALVNNRCKYVSFILVHVDGVDGELSRDGSDRPRAISKAPAIVRDTVDVCCGFGGAWVFS